MSLVLASTTRLGVSRDTGGRHEMPDSYDEPATDDANEPSGSRSRRVPGDDWQFDRSLPADTHNLEEMRQWLQDLANDLVLSASEVTVETVPTDGAAAGTGPADTYQFVVCSGKRGTYPDDPGDDTGGADGDADDEPDVKG
jgi:hypothetical protein